MAASFYNLAAFRLCYLTARYLPRAICQRLAPAISTHLARRKNPASLVALRKNLGLVTGHTGLRLEALCLRNVRNFSRMLSDYFFCASREPTAAHRLLESWDGFDHFTAARAAGKGTIILTGHLGHWELGGVLLALRGIPVTVVTLEEPSSALSAWRERYRRAVGIKTITVGPGREFAFVEMLRVLRENGCLAMLVDRPYEGTGSPVTFFGHHAEFSSAAALLWQHTGAAVIPAFVTRQPSSRYKAHALAPLALSTEGGPRAALAANTQTIASTFESVIRETPDQWFNYVPVWPQLSA